MDWLVSLVSPEALEEMITAHPWHFIAWTAVSFCFGFFIGNWYNKREKKELEERIASLNKEKERVENEISERKKRIAGLQAAIENEKRKNAELASRMGARKELERKENAREIRRNWLLGLEPEKKLQLLQIKREGSLIMGPMGEEQFSNAMGSKYYGIGNGLEQTKIGGCYGRYHWRLSLNEEGDKAVNENMDLLMEVEEFSNASKEKQAIEGSN